MRTLGLIIKTASLLIVILIGVLAVLAGLKWLAVGSIFAMLILFLMQSTEVFMGYKK